MNSADINAYQKARKSVVYDGLERQMIELETSLMEVECRKTAALVREARRALKWEFGIPKPQTPAAGAKL